MKILILFTFLNLTFIEVEAKTLNTKITGDTKAIYLDDNNDKKADLIETYQKDVLMKKEQDLNFDGVMDETTEYFYDVPEDKPFAIITKKDRKSKIYRNEKLKLIIKTTEIDTDGDGKYNRVITENFPLIQKADVCEEGQKPVSQKADTLSDQVLKVVGKVTDNQYVENKLGYKIDKACINNFGEADFSNIVTQSMAKGLACLEDLAKKNTEADPKGPNGALNNYEGLNRLLKQKKVTIVCSEKDYSWEGTAGHASSNPADKIKELGVEHPFISINPNDPKTKGKPTGKEVAYLNETIFHEQLHNLGILHGKDVEYPYACETCCISSKEEYEGTKAAACKICSGQYDVSKGTSKQYLVDLLDWGKKSYDSQKAEAAIKSYQLEHPQNKWAATLAAKASAGVFSAVGVEMAKILKKKTPLSTEEKLNIDEALDYQDYVEVASVSAKAKVIALAHLNYYYEDNPEATIKTLQDNKDVIKKIVNSTKVNISDESLNYVNEKLLEDTKGVLMALFLRGYPDKQGPSSDVAYEMLKEFKLL